jgi:hypothetical protein
VERVVRGVGGKTVTLKNYIVCDGCGKDILESDPPHKSRPEFERQTVQDMVAVLPRRDLCDACCTRLLQVIRGYLPNCEWLLDGFEVERK